MPTTMDRISNKLKLVRSQSMGVGMGGQAGEAKVVARPEGRPTQVVLLDERRLELNVHCWTMLREPGKMSWLMQLEIQPLR